MHIADLSRYAVIVEYLPNYKKVKLDLQDQKILVHHHKEMSYTPQEHHIPCSIQMEAFPSNNRMDG